MKKKIGKAMVVGGGISGIRSALDLAETGYSVILIDRAPNLGGILSQLDYQFPNDHCGMCKMLPMVNRDSCSQECLRRGFFHENIEVMLSTEVISVDGDAGNFEVTVRQEPTWIDSDLCMGCGDCVSACPVEIPDTFNTSLDTRKAIFLPVPHNVSNAYKIDIEACTLCGECVQACPTDAISLPTEKREIDEKTINVGAVILSGGTSYFDPKTGKNTYGYGDLPDVVTSREYERLISGTGPQQGQLLRPSNGEPIRNIAWFQCVGSRDLQTNSDFCSSICCMHAIKEARLAKDRSRGGIQTTIFYMDMRTFGKSFQEYRDQAETEYGVEFVRSRVHSVTENAADHTLHINYLDHEGKNREESYDMIVLSVGQRPSEHAQSLAEAAGAEVNQWGFCQPEPFSTSKTQRDGVFIGGSFSGLMDIGESVIQASAAALGASRVLHSSGGGLAPELKPTIPYRDTSLERAKILIAICTNGVIPVEQMNREKILQQFKFDPTVDQVVFLETTNTQDNWEELVELVKNEQPNRLLIGAALPHIFIRKKNELGMETGINPELIEVVDVINVGANIPMERKLNGMLTGSLKMGITQLKYRNTDQVANVPVQQKALVIGGGIAGMTSALSIAQHGYEVDLVEKSDELGGNLHWLDKTLEGHDIRLLMNNTIADVEDHALINTHLTTCVESATGQAGNFQVSLKKENDTQTNQLKYGTIIIATGGEESATLSYNYEQSEAIITQKELTKGLTSQEIDPQKMNSLVMIQCVDSREQFRNYCSRVCCSTALKNALKLLELNPNLSITVFYRDMMSYGFTESFFTEARKKGVLFIQYEKDNKPEVTVVEDRLKVTGYEPILGRDIEINTDLVVLATGVRPNYSKRLADGLNIQVESHGFFQEAESKWRPVDSIKDGVFACGLAHSPRNITESIASAQAAAQKSLRILSDDKLIAAKTVAAVRQSLCSHCERCIEVCPYEARTIDPETDEIVVNPAMCQGCGACAAVCPNSASILNGFSDQLMLDEISLVVSSMNT